MTTTIGDKTYTIKDNYGGIYPISKLLTEDIESIYGGRVTKYAMAKDNKSYILLLEETNEGLVVVDIAVKELKHFPREIIKKIAEMRKIKFGSSTSTEDLIKRIIA